jgi:hypothetical protein
MTAELINVRGDGNCFYRAVYKSCLLNGYTDLLKSLNCKTLLEDTFVTCLRQKLADRLLETKPTFLKNMFEHWWQVRRTTPKDLKQIFSFMPDWYFTAFKLYSDDNFEGFLREVAENIKTSGKYAGEIEVTLFKDYLSSQGFKFVILSGNVNNLKSTPNTIYIYNVDNEHYNAVQLHHIHAFTYKNNVVDQPSCGPSGCVISGGKSACVLYNGDKRKHIVHTDNKKKYIVVKGDNIYLGSIRGKYRYVERLNMS